MNKRQLKEVPENEKKESLSDIHHEFVMCIARLEFLEQATEAMNDSSGKIDANALYGLVEIIKDVRKEIELQADALDVIM